MQSAVDVQGAAWAYPDGTRALDPVSLRVPQGQFISLVGSSGCGKSTLLKMIAGLLQPRHGTVRVGGRDPARVEGRGDEPVLSFVFQEPTLMPWATVLANVRLPLDLARVPAAQAQARAMDALTAVGLAGAARQRPRQLSGGMQMRVSIARALVTRPTLLLMDEPFGALDEITRQQLDDDLLALCRARPALTVVFVTHAVGEAVFLSDRVVVMGGRPGRLMGEVQVSPPGPRDEGWREAGEFAALCRAVRTALREGHTAAGRPA